LKIIKTIDTNKPIIMNISRIFNLNKTQYELDFIDIDTQKDIPLFVDPKFLSIRKDKFSYDATKTIQSFFQKVIVLLKNKRIEEAKELFEHLGEPNSTCLGLSKGNPNGKGVGLKNTASIFENLLKSKAVDTGLIKDLEDNILFVDNFDKDRLSDMTTNIITLHLIEYTESQCNLLGIPMQDGVPSGYYWNSETEEWEINHRKMLVIDGKVILLVPKGIVSFCDDYTPQKYSQHFVKNFYQNEHLKMKSALVRERASGKEYVTKKDVQQTDGVDGTKEFLRKFSLEHPEILEKFKKSIKTKSLENIQLSSINISELAQFLISQLQKIPVGNKAASVYHKFILGILEILFYPYLIYPANETPINDARKRIDITFHNAADEGIFQRFHPIYKLRCPFIMIECKNYSADPNNPELDQLAGRFYNGRGKVGFLLCRNVGNMKLLLQKCSDSYKEGRGLIIPITDEDILNLLSHINIDYKEYFDFYISKRVQEITIN